MAEKKKKKTDEAETPVVDQVDSADAESTASEPEPDATPVEETVDEVSTEPASEEPAPEEAEVEPVVHVAAEADEPEAPAEDVAEESPAEEPAPEPAAEVVAEEPLAEAVAEEPAAEEPAAEAAPPAPQSGPKPKKKRLPRSERPARTKKKVAKPAARKPIVRLEKPEHERGRRQERQGTVVSNAMDKTIVVKVDTLKAHRKYQKVVRRSNTFHAHDEANQANVGDVVRIVETRPVSKTKRWRLAEIVEAAK